MEGGERKCDHHSYTALQLLKSFPAEFDSDSAAIEGSGELVRFQRSVCRMIGEIHARLSALGEFVDGTDSLQQAMTVAVTVRDITKVETEEQR